METFLLWFVLPLVVIFSILVPTMNSYKRQLHEEFEQDVKKIYDD